MTLARTRPAQRLREGDVVQVKHPSGSPTSARVIAVGRIGVTVEFPDGARFRMPLSGEGPSLAKALPLFTGRRSPAGAEGRKQSAPHQLHGAVLPGDQVYVRHPTAGPMAVKVIAAGKQGVTAECEKGGRYRVAYDSVLGHRARMLQGWQVLDQGVEGAILKGQDGARRYLAGEIPTAPAAKAGPEPVAERAWEDDDPLLDGLDRIGLASAAQGQSFQSLETTDKALTKALGTERWRPARLHAKDRRAAGIHEAGHIVVLRALGGVDSRDSVRVEIVIQGCLLGGGLGRIGSAGVERRGVGSDGAAHHRPA